jgi:hypothetical protein
MDVDHEEHTGAGEVVEEQPVDIEDAPAVMEVPPLAAEEPAAVVSDDEPVLVAGDGTPIECADIGASLPDPEEIKTEMGRKKSIKKWQIIALVTACLLVLIIGVSVGVSDSKSSKSSNTLDSPDAAANATRYHEVIDFLTMFTPRNILEKDGTPQHAAANWIATIDKDKYVIPSHADADMHLSYYFVQRYVLAVLYYAMGGENWTYKSRFLSKAVTCEWNQGFKLDNVQRYDFGVKCADNERITDIFMRKLLSRAPP